MRRSADYWIKKLKLAKHPEGGYFREVYRSDEIYPRRGLPKRFPGSRAMSTSIYYLLKAGEFSSFHRLRSDEIWHFYAGSALTLSVISPRGALTTLKLGPHPDRGEAFQAMVPAGHWFAAQAKPPASYSLVGCTLAPGFDFKDFDLADCKRLKRVYPQYQGLIESFTRS
ncbi:MAG: cupin domain-containing protein [Candidatus Omnitrophica bacterium]|nr:cupin domain-containing protein [Candidatus Omnitrophota bacterium]MDD5670537.1 cupin domain-containing protein [Candidatus Omnitrophota bacterium]